MPKLNTPVDADTKDKLDRLYACLREDLRSRARVAMTLRSMGLHDLDPVEFARRSRPSARGQVLETGIGVLRAIADGRLVALTPEQLVGELVEAMGAVIAILERDDRLLNMDDDTLRESVTRAMSAVMNRSPDAAKADCRWPDVNARFAAEHRAVN